MHGHGGPHGAGPYWDNRDSSHTGSAEPIYPAMKDLQNMAACLNLGDDPSLNELLRISEDSIEKARTFAQRGKLDHALVNYFRASDIALNTIPRHSDFTYMKQHHPRWGDQFAKLITMVDSQHATMENIKRIIIANNSVPNGEQYTQSRPSSQWSSRNVERQDISTSTPPSSNEPPLRMPSPSGFRTTPTSTNGNSHRQHASLSNFNSEARPKPTGLGRNPATDADAQRDPLIQRFSGLTNQRQNRMSAPLERNNIGHIPSPHMLSNSISSQERPQSQGQSSQPTPPQSRPLGPREMNSHYGGPPSIPPKLPLSSINSSLPRYPSPAYSPIWTVPTQPPPNPPRKSAESSRSAVYKQTPSLMGNSSDSIHTIDDNPYRSQTPNGVRIEGESRSRSADIAVGATIHAKELMEYLRRYDILLIDVRPRDRFDNGHIYSKCIMCIEPVVLKENVSAEDLEDRLIISPEAEQSLFAKRNEFDLIVYYDQSTTEPSYLAGSPAGNTMPHLRALYDTLYEFNIYKPLKDGRQPTLLVGGLDAWIDLVGPQSLATSHTAAILSSVRSRKPVPDAGTSLRRFPTASANSSWEVKKRRLRDYKPLDKEEERAWLEKARNEEIDASSYVTDGRPIMEEPAPIDETVADVNSPFIHTYEDFLKRFPEPRDIRQSMVSAGSSPQFPVHDTSAIGSPLRPPPAVPRPSYSGVADNRQVQPPLVRQSSANKHPLYSSPLDRMKLPRTGLLNLGSTCYMNSIIQSLSATTQLTKFFIDNQFHSQVQGNWKGSQGVLPGLYANLIRSLWKNDVEVIRPTSFRKFVGRLNPEWASSKQQDAKEFFDVLVDCLHEDLNLNWQRTPLKPLTFEQEIRREKMPINEVSSIEWDRYCHRELSYPSSLFAGQHASRLRCTTCRMTSTTYEAFYSISVEVPPSGSGDIYQCLRSYCQEEMLSGDEEWKCPHCRRQREATKQIILTRAPRFLVIHFKKFTASRRQQARKIHSSVHFPLTGLDMSPFMIQSPATQSVSPQPPNGHQSTPSPTPAPSPPQSSLKPNDLATSSPYIYNAYSVVRHLGSSIHEGHYISLVRDAPRGCWRKFDDQRVTDFKPSNSRLSSDNLQNEQAYLVFYERPLAN